MIAAHCNFFKRSSTYAAWAETPTCTLPSKSHKHAFFAQILCDL
ncbi:hypothetical protein HMPREF3216_01074 [Gardnerella vaginalis]|uniref:Uncharacterized protein n=1 Tax=Gardnerella vaginalis TaxID=2702 RepID=A0A133NMU9_GARVA|nr:hypothetical protein HMPREF3216_01074 [Gardnerella vaginalis]